MGPGGYAGLSIKFLIGFFALLAFIDPVTPLFNGQQRDGAKSFISSA